MPASTSKSYVAKAPMVDRQWWLVDASDAVLGRLAARVAVVLMGKHKPTYTPHVDCGDHVVIINAEKVRITGKKLDQRSVERYSYYPGGRKVIPLRRYFQRFPERVVERAVRRMLPKNTLGRQMYRKLKVYQGPEHPHQAQNPEPMSLRR